MSDYLIWSANPTEEENSMWWALDLNPLPEANYPGETSPDAIAAAVTLLGASGPTDLAMIFGADGEDYSEGYNLETLPGLTMGSELPGDSTPWLSASMVTFPGGSGVAIIAGEGGAPWLILTTKAGALAWGKVYGFGRGLCL